MGHRIFSYSFDAAFPANILHKYHRMDHHIQATRHTALDIEQDTLLDCYKALKK